MPRDKRLRVAYLSHLDMNLYLFRLSWMKALRARGHEVTAIVPRGEFFDRFKAHGIKTIEFDMKRGGIKNPLREILSLLRLYGALKGGGFDILHTFTMKPNIYGSLAGKPAGIPVIINHITGLGYVFTEKGLKAGFLRAAGRLLYRVSFKAAKRVVFQNPDDMEELCGLCGGEKAVLVRGTGVDVDYFSPGASKPEALDALRKELGIEDRNVVVTLIGRLLRHKGIVEFVEAAKTININHKNAVFLIVGWPDEGNPAVLPEDFVREAGRDEFIKFLGKREDVREILELTDIYVLPSYREGTPRTVLEAMAMGKPVVTTDVPGCRQTVRDGINGLLVPPRDSRAISAAVQRLLADGGLRKSMGAEGRRIAVGEFSDTVVTERIMGLYDALTERP